MTDNQPVRSRARPAAAQEGSAEENKAAAQPNSRGLQRSSRALGGAAGDGDTSWMKSGEEGMADAERARAERAQRDAEAANRPVRPMRFKLDWNVKDGNGNQTGRGEIADIIILDTQPGPRFWEHTARNPRTGYWTETELCCREWDNCPLCPPEGEKQPYYVMMLTVIDMREFTDREGNVWAATRKLLPVKIEKQGIFDDLYREHGSLRGVHLIMAREGGKMSSPIGDNIQFDCIHTEAEIEEYAKSTGLWEEYKQQNGRVIWGEGEFIQPYQYGRIFEKPSAAKLLLKYNPNSQQGGHIGGQSDHQGDGWRPGTNPGRAAGNPLARQSQRRVNLDDAGGGTAGDIDDNIPF